MRQTEVQLGLFEFLQYVARQIRHFDSKLNEMPFGVLRAIITSRITYVAPSVTDLGSNTRHHIDTREKRSELSTLSRESWRNVLPPGEDNCKTRQPS